MNICAVSTPPGRGGIAVIRVSGPDAISIVDKIWEGKPLSNVDSHTAHLGNVKDCHGRFLDQSVATVFRAPKSYTGEDVVEIAVHGSQYIQRTLLQALIETGARIAEPGEFTQRAFINGKLDLIEAEAVADIIASSSRASHSLAASQLNGSFSTHIDSLREELIKLASLLELELDFSEEDIAFADRNQLESIAKEIIAHVSKLINTFSYGQSIKDGIRVAIVGRPNAGKSSLLNSLIESNRAIVSNIPGTTRDSIEETYDIEGVTFRFIDTAGIRDTSDPIERLGIDRTYSNIKDARIIISLIDPEESEADAKKQYEEIESIMASGATIITVYSKSDLYNEKPDGVAVSVVSEEGLNELKQRLYEIAIEGMPDDESMVVTNARHFSALTSARSALLNVVDAINNGLTADLIAEHLREAIDNIGAITGAITSGDVLKSIFENFCIGK